MRLALLFLILLGGSAMSGAGFAQPGSPAPSPGEILAAAPAGDWLDIAEDDLLVMALAPDARGKSREVIIQLIPAPFTQGWVGNIRTLAKAHWYDGIAVVRVQDNYVAQWGDAGGEDGKTAKPLPAGLRTMAEGDYVAAISVKDRAAAVARLVGRTSADSYADYIFMHDGWPLAANKVSRPPLKEERDKSIPTPATEPAWPVHCYGSVGVGRGLSPDTGSGAELYAVIGHAPRHLDRNIAVVGRVIEGMEHLSSLPRGTGQLGFYETAGERTSILSVRLARDLPAATRPRFQYLSTQSTAFERYADARANRRDPFFIVPAGGADICNIPVPVRRKP